jgi:hypothetical protein
MGLLGRLDLKYFLLAFGIGLLVCYVMTPPPEVVVKFPSPYNAGKVMYTDKAGTCFMYRADKSTCPSDRALIRDQPIMEDFRGKQLQRLHH